LKETSIRSGSKSAAVVPIAARYPAPVGVAAEDRTLEQVAPRDGPADLHRVLLGGGVLDRDRDVVRRPFGIAQQLQRQVMAGLVQGGLEVDRRGRTPDAPLLIRITVSLVDMQPSLSTGRSWSGRPPGVDTQLVSVDDRVRGDHTSMVARPGASNAGALGHAADRPPLVGEAGLHWTPSRWS
jgi:hypothetical protein